LFRSSSDVREFAMALLKFVQAGLAGPEKAAAREAIKAEK
jgi:hypothetical protein